MQYYGRSHKIPRLRIYRNNDDWVMSCQAQVTEQIRCFFPYGVDMLRGKAGTEKIYGAM